MKSQEVATAIANLVMSQAARHDRLRAREQHHIDRSESLGPINPEQAEAHLEAAAVLQTKVIEVVAELCKLQRARHRVGG